MNIPASIFAHLKKWAKIQGQDLQYVLFRYANERILYRLSVSPEAHNFVLKGATMFLVWNGRVHRVTKDIDLLGYGDPDPERLAALFREIAVTPCEEDGMVFDPATLEVTPIREELEYGGVRVTMRARLGRADLPVQMDVGFGDAVDPRPIEIELPTMLTLPVPRLRAYPREVVLSEKLEAMVRIGRENSRMKDFYDVWLLLQTAGFDETLGQSIGATFARRATPLPAQLPDALSDDFADDPIKQTQWKAFLRRSMTDEKPVLSVVVAAIRDRLWPVIQAERALAVPFSSVSEGTKKLATFIGEDGALWVERGVVRDQKRMSR